MKKYPILAGMCLALLIGASIAAQATTINFENDAFGPKPNGWQSMDSPVISFTDSVGAGLFIDDFGYQGNGKSLGILDDLDDSALIMDFASPINSLSLWFGNDDPAASNLGDKAVLRGYLGGTEVLTAFVEMNRNDIMDQMISIGGASFDKATFKYEVTSSWGLVEIVDDINFTAVPEPSSLLALAAGLPALAGLAIRRRYRTQ